MCLMDCHVFNVYCSFTHLQNSICLLSVTHTVWFVERIQCHLIDIIYWFHIMISVSIDPAKFLAKPEHKYACTHCSLRQNFTFCHFIQGASGK